MSDFQHKTARNTYEGLILWIEWTYEANMLADVQNNVVML